MADLTFDELMIEDIKNIFLSDDFSQDAIYESGGKIKTITVQFFEQPLDRLNTQYFYAWCNFSEITYVEKDKSTLTINGIKYGVMSAKPDEFKHGIDLFLQKV